LQQSSNNTFKRELHLRDYFLVLDRHKWIIIAALIVTLASTVLYQRKQVPIYHAQTSIIIEEPSRTQEMVLPRNVPVVDSDYLYLETQLNVITTTPVLATAVKQMALTDAPEGTEEFNSAVDYIRDSIKVTPVKDTRIVNISVSHTEPEKAQAIANAVAQAYIEQDRVSRLQSGRDSIKWLSTQLADLKIKIKKSEDAFQQYKEREGMITLDEKRSAELDEIAKFNDSYLTARSSRMEVETIIDKLASENQEDVDIPVALLGNPNLQKLGTELSQLQADLTEKRRTFKETYPGIIKLKERIKSSKQQILSELKRQKDFLEAQEKAFLSQQESKRQNALKLGKKEIDYLTLEREVTTNREMYNGLLTKVKELSLSGGVDLNNIRIVEPAELPVGATGIDKKMTLALGGILGLFLGIGFAFFLEYLNNTIKTPDDIEQYLELPLLAIIPQVLGAKKSKTPMIIMKENMKDASAEAYRSLRTNLVSTGLGDSMKTFTITSTGPREGKSLTTVNLGAAIAQSGLSVLIIDADLRRPKLHRVFGVDRRKGLSALLTGSINLDESIVETDISNLSLITAGSVPSNPSELLGSVLMKELIKHFRDIYDVVILDSAPVLGMSDALVLARETDGTILIVKTDTATRKALKFAISQLEQVSAKICGVILNNVNVKRDRYYHYYYYYYYSPYEDEEGKKIKKRKKRSRHQEDSSKSKGKSEVNVQ
jgi:polysaccharide biosynthesis transport protein